MKNFTLIELILAIIIIALAGGVATAIVGSVSRHGKRSALLMNRAGDLHNVCENMRAVYQQAYTADLDGLQILIGTSGTMDNEFGGYHVVENKFIEFKAEDPTNSGGTWNEIESTDSSGDFYRTALKVIIKHTSGQEKVTMVFVDEEVVDDGLF